MNVRLERSLITLLANELPHHGTTDRETDRQHRIAPLLVPVRADNLFPQIDRQWSHLIPSLESPT
jgi:hypothetical protein